MAIFSVVLYFVLCLSVMSFHTIQLPVRGAVTNKMKTSHRDPLSVRCLMHFRASLVFCEQSNSHNNAFVQHHLQ